MDLRITNDTVQLLKCFICKNFLSCFPIYLIGDNENVCGRCKVPKTGFRNSVYEIVASNMRFPCRFKDKGCCTELIPEKIIAHEDACPFRPVACPYCGQEEFLNNVLKHCSQDHQREPLENNTLILVESAPKLTILQTRDNVFVVMIEYVKGTLQLGEVSDFCGKSTVDYKVILTKDKVKLTLEASKMVFDNSGRFEMNLNWLKNYNEDAPISLRFSFDDLTQKQPTHTVRLASQVKVVDYTVPRFRNLATLACKYEGCPLVLQAADMNQHQSACPYQHLSCFMSDYGESCIWTGLRKDLKTHIEDEHVVLDGDQPFLQCSLTFRRISGRCHIIRKHHYLFRVVFSRDISRNTMYKWFAHAITPVTEDFKYEIELRNSDKLFIMRQKCSSKLLGKNELLKEKDCCFLPEDQVQFFCKSNGRVKYKVRIYQD